jgi:hypothetical protein
MAFAATTIWRAYQGGNSANGGGFDPANANMSTNLAATVANTASPVVTSATYNFIARDVGTYLFIQSGTNWVPGWYPIASVASNAATLNAAVGAVLLYGGATVWNTVAGCASVASPTAGKWSVDYSWGTGPAITYTDLVIGAGANTSQFTSAANPAGPHLIGNVINVTSGTGFTVQRIQVVSVATTTATADKVIGTASSTGGNGKLGGMVDHPATVGGLLIAGNVLLWKYSATASLFGATANASGGRVSTNFAGDLVIQGYDTTPALDNTDANRPIARINANSVTAFTLQSGSHRLAGVVVDNPSAFTTAAAVSFSGNATLASRVKASGMTSGIPDRGRRDPIGSTAMMSGSNTTSARFSLSIGTAVRCVVQAAAGSGVAFGGGGLGATCIDCVAINHPANAFSFTSASSNTLIHRCVSYNTTGAGFTVAADTDCEWCIAYGSSGLGFALGSAQTTARLRNCAGGANGTANYQSTFRADLVANFQALAGNPFNNPGSLDFGVNSAVGAGAAVRNLTATLPGLATTTYEDAARPGTRTVPWRRWPRSSSRRWRPGTTGTPTAVAPRRVDGREFPVVMAVLANSGTITASRRVVDGLQRDARQPGARSSTRKITRAGSRRSRAGHRDAPMGGDGRRGHRPGDDGIARSGGDGLGRRVDHVSVGHDHDDGGR